MALGATHYNLGPKTLEFARDVSSRFGVSFNSYIGHGHPSGHSSSQTVDFWGPGGRGDPLDEATGDAVVSWVLGQRAYKDLAMIIWWSWWWRPNHRWQPYGGLHGNHGPGRDAHVHVVIE